MTGRVEEKPPNPMEGMTEEQKEHEAMKLVNMFDKLSRCVAWHGGPGPGQRRTTLSLWVLVFPGCSNRLVQACR